MIDIKKLNKQNIFELLCAINNKVYLCFTLYNDNKVYMGYIKRVIDREKVEFELYEGKNIITDTIEIEKIKQIKPFSECFRKL